MSIKFQVFVVTVFLAMSFGALQSNWALAADKKPKERLAVLDLDAKYGIDKGLAEALSGIVRDKIHSFGEFQVMSKEDIQSVVTREQLKQAMGCDDGGSQCLVEFGRMIGTRFMVAGDISKIGTTYTISLRMLDTQGEGAGVTNRVRESCKCNDDGLIGAVEDVAAKLLGKPSAMILKKTEDEEAKKLADEKKKAAEAEQKRIAEERRKADEEKQKIAAETERLKKEKANADVERNRLSEENKKKDEALKLIAQEKKGAEQAERQRKVDEGKKILANETERQKNLKDKAMAEAEQKKNASESIKSIQNVEPSTITAQQGKQDNLLKHKFDGYKVAILPWQLLGDGSSFSGFLADIIVNQIRDTPGLTLVKSSYQQKGVGSITNVNEKDLYKASFPDLEKLNQLGAELDFNVVILGKLNLSCASMHRSECTRVPRIDFVIVDLTTGKTYIESGSSYDREAREVIDSYCRAAFKKFTAGKADEEKQKMANETERQKNLRGKAVAEAEQKKSASESIKSIQSAESSATTAQQGKQDNLLKHKFDGYKVAILPWQFLGEGTSFSGLLADIIVNQIRDTPGLTLVKSSYHQKGVGSITNVNEKDLYKASFPDLEKLNQLGAELDFNVAILGKLNLPCIGNNVDVCTKVRRIDFVIVDLTTGKTYIETGSSYDREAREVIDSYCRAAFKKFAAEMKK